MLTYDVVSTTAYAEKTAHERRYCTQRQPVIANPPPLHKHNHGRFRLQPPLLHAAQLSYLVSLTVRLLQNVFDPIHIVRSFGG